MRARIALVAGIGIGYVLGARAGRESYEKIKTQATNVWHDPKVQEGIKATEETIKEKAPVVAEKAKEAAGRLPFEKVLNECFATPHVLRFQLAQPKAKPAPPPEKPEETHDDDDDDEDVFRMAQDMFAAQVVGRSGQG